jgi:hypothetical protein
MVKGMVGHGTISPDDLSLYTSTDDPAEAVKIVRSVARTRRGDGAARRILRKHRVKKGLPV